MITNKELEALELSTTKKDFYQIFNEILDAAQRITERWDPTSTNESDPGIVLLKVLAAIADKLNYNIDKNTLEAFMPSAAQEESMRKLCEMMGYSMKYYQSAETTATISWIGKVSSGKFVVDGSTDPVDIISIPKFRVLKNQNEDIIYTTTEQQNIGTIDRKVEINCIEGEVVQCQTNNNNIININNLDDNYRFYLPEQQIAENGIFIFNVNSDGVESSKKWSKEDNLNTVTLGQKCYKFGFDSKKRLPYVQFPKDASIIMENGVRIYFTRTTGVNGNIKANTLSIVEPFTLTGDIKSSDTTIAVTNKNAATNGMNAETLTQAYNSYKKVIGTFDTLVTCRDYMNKIYQLVDENNVPLVSNIIASDIRDDINRSVQVCSFNEFGISYTDSAVDEDEINNFNLILYPFKTVYGLNNKNEYVESFKYSTANLDLIKDGIKKTKTLSHDIITPDDDEIACIKNYLKLNAKITTTKKVNAIEQKNILENIYTAIYATFNMRQLEFGEDIPFDSILTCIENADVRIKNVSLDEPEIETAICLANGTELTEKTKPNEQYKNYYIKLVARNVLAGRVPLFKYNKQFSPSVTETKYENKELLYEDITTLQTGCDIDITQPDRKLTDNEVVQFRAPNFKTEVTYPAYVNFYAQLDSAAGDNDAIAAKFKSLRYALTTNDFVALAQAHTDKLIEPSGTWPYGYPHLTSVGELSPSGTYIFPINRDTFVIVNQYFENKTIADDVHYSGLYEQKASDTSRDIGYLVDGEYHKYQLRTTALSYDYTRGLDIYFVQDSAGANQSNMYNLGKNSTFQSNENTERELKSTEKIYFSYSQSDPNDDKKKVQKYVCYGEGTVVKANFPMARSNRTGANLSKSITPGTGFIEDGTGNTIQCEFDKMETLGSNGQIEIRKPITVELKPDSGKDGDNKNISVYWELNNKSKIFPATPYILKDGEYFFYTDLDKTSMAYYGAGCEIKIEGSLTLKLPESAKEVSVEDILDNGLDIVPWLKINVTENNYIKINEYQFITLAKDDILKNIELDDSTITTLSNDFKKCKSAEYTLNGADSSLPGLVSDNYSWEVRSRLELNVGPNLTQTLYNTEDYIQCGSGSNPIRPDSNNKPLSFKTNVLIQSTLDQLSFTEDEYLYVKVFKNEALKTSENTAVSKNNFGSTWTEITFEKDGESIALHAAIADDQFGIIMVYYNGAVEHGTITPNSGGSIYYLNGETLALASVAGTYYLKPGINVLGIEHDVTQLTLTVNSKDELFIISELDIVDGNWASTAKGFDIDLLGINSSDVNTLYNQLKEYEDFYWNTPIDNSIAIDFNEEAGDNLAKETILYDYNNINSKFVISEIDADYMENGIQIARTSKL